MKFDKVKCSGCETKTRPLFMRSPPRHPEDVWCKPCMDERKHIE